MKKLQQKIKKNLLLIKSRQAELDQESVLLSKIRSQKLSALNELKKSQIKYVEGVEVLNQERQSPNRSKLDPLERSLDYAKLQWHKCLTEVRKLEEKEKSQLQNVLETRTKLKALQRLVESDSEDLRSEASKREQKNLDELATQRYIRS